MSCDICWAVPPLRTLYTCRCAPVLRTRAHHFTVHIFTDFQEDDIKQIEPDYLFPFMRRLLNLRAAHDGYRPPEDKDTQLDPSKMTVTVDVVKTDLNML